jgi:hypothetical protein
MLKSAGGSKMALALIDAPDPAGRTALMFVAAWWWWWLVVVVGDGGLFVFLLPPPPPTHVTSV